MKVVRDEMEQDDEGSSKRWQLMLEWTYTIETSMSCTENTKMMKKKKKPSAVKKGDTQGWSLLIGYWDLSYKRCWQETQTINKGAARWRKILAKKDNFGTGFLKNTKMGLWSKRRPFVQGGGWSIHKASSV